MGLNVTFSSVVVALVAFAGGAAIFCLTLLFRQHMSRRVYMSLLVGGTVAMVFGVAISFLFPQADVVTLCSSGGGEEDSGN